MKTTLNKIKALGHLRDEWKTLRLRYPKKKADDPISMLEILNEIGFKDALRCMEAVDGYDKEMRLFSVWCFRQAQHLTTDTRSLMAPDVAERFANGHATVAELAAAEFAAMDANRGLRIDEESAAQSAAMYTAWNRACVAARAGAKDSAYALAFAASSKAKSFEASVAAREKALHAARAAQEQQLRKVLADIEKKEKASENYA